MPNANNRKGNPVTNPSSVPRACEKNYVAYVMGHNHTHIQRHTHTYVEKTLENIESNLARQKGRGQPPLATFCCRLSSIRTWLA